MPHVSDSTEQRLAERWLVQQLSERLGIQLEPATVPLGDSVRIAADGFNSEHHVFCEAYAHIGRTRGGQPHKIARDILKMLAAERRLGGSWRKILCFADEAAAVCIRGRSWLAAVCVDLGIEVHVFPLPLDLRRAVEVAQARQVMVNQS